MSYLKLNELLKYISYLVLPFIILLFTSCGNTPSPKKPASKNQKEVTMWMNKAYQLVLANKFDSLKIVCKKGLPIVSPGVKTQAAYLNLLMGSAFLGRHENDSALYYYKRALAFSPADDKGRNIEIFAAAQINLVNIYYTLGKPDSVNSYKEKMTAEVDTMRNIKVKMSLLKELGQIYFKTNQPENALKADFQLLSYFRNKKDSTELGKTMVEMSNVYELLFDFEKAKSYLLEGIPYINSDLQNKMIAFNNLAICYDDLKQYDKAITAYNKSIDIAKKIRDTDYMHAAYIGICTPLFELKQYDKVTKYLNDALVYYNTSKNEDQLLDILELLAKTEARKGNYIEAIGYYEKAVQSAKASGHIINIPDTYNYLADVASKAGLYQKAYHYELTYGKLRDSLSQASTKKSITDLEVKYQTNEKEQKIKLLNQASQLKDIELTGEKRKWGFLLVFVGFLLVTAFLLYRSYALKANSNKLLEQKNVALNLLNDKLNEANSSKTKLFSILSHDLRAPVGNLFSFLNIQKNHSHKLSPEQQAEHNDRIRQSAENLMESMEDLLIWSKSQMNSFSLNPVQINAAEMVEYVMGINRDFAAERKLLLDGSSGTCAVLFSDVNFLKIVLRNIVSNAIKFTPAGGSIKIFAQQVDGSVQFTIADTGLGITKEQIANLFEWNSIRSDSSGLGLKLAKEFTIRLGGSLAVHSELDKGTTFTVLIPV